jgi:hypothetical protein
MAKILFHPNMIMSYFTNLEMSYSKGAIMALCKGERHGSKAQKKFRIQTKESNYTAKRSSMAEI